VIAQINRYADVGIRHLVIEPVSSNQQDFLEQLESFAEEIAPAFAGAIPVIRLHETQGALPGFWWRQVSTSAPGAT
jgi:hypothetical protein